MYCFLLPMLRIARRSTWCGICQANYSWREAGATRKRRARLYLRVVLYSTLVEARQRAPRQGREKRSIQSKNRKGTMAGLIDRATTANGAVGHRLTTTARVPKRRPSAAQPHTEQTTCMAALQNNNTQHNNASSGWMLFECCADGHMTAAHARRMWCSEQGGTTARPSTSLLFTILAGNVQPEATGI